MATQTTPQNVAEHATQTRQLKSRGLQLLGLFGSQNEPQALLRLPSGRLRRVSAGEQLSAGRVLAIDPQGIILERKGTARRLVMPGS